MFSHVKHDEICGKEWDFSILIVKTFFLTVTIIINIITLKYIFYIILKLLDKFFILIWLISNNVGLKYLKFT